MDPNRQALGAVTMVYKDYDFLKRWYDYYCQQLGPENLYVFSHGNDPEHRDIAPLANVLNVPRDPHLHKFDRRRWRMLGQFASAMLEFYNWMLVTDVDEILVVDPAVSEGLVAHITARYGGEGAPFNIAPLGLELIHIPEEEPLPIEANAPILSRRRIFRPSRNYSKPCLVGRPVLFGPGGHRNTLGPRHLADDLYLLHLKYFDLPTLQARAREKQAIVAAAQRGNPDFQDGKGPWNNILDGYTLIVDGVRKNGKIEGEDIALPRFRAGMRQQVEKFKHQYVWGPAKTPNLYRIPERFASVF